MNFIFCSVYQFPTIINYMEGLDERQAHKRNRRETEQREIEDIVNRIWREHGIEELAFLEGNSLKQFIQQVLLEYQDFDFDIEQFLPVNQKMLKAEIIDCVLQVTERIEENLIVLENLEDQIQGANAPEAEPE